MRGNLRLCSASSLEAQAELRNNLFELGEDNLKVSVIDDGVYRLPLATHGM